MWLHIHAGLINGAQCVATALRFSIHCGWGPFISCLRVIHVSHMDKIYIFESMGNTWQLIMKMPARFNAALCSYVFFMMASSNWIIFRVTDLLWVEFTGHRRRIPHTKASDVELWWVFYLRLNKLLSKPSRRRWFRTPSCSLGRHYNVLFCVVMVNFCGTAMLSVDLFITD